jgi:hypothetical protein
MSRNTPLRSMLALLVLASGLVLAGRGAVAGSPADILVVPARKLSVRLGFHLMQVREVGLVSYRTLPGREEPLMHVWNGRDWVEIGLEEFRAGSFLPATPRRLFIVGDRSVLPASLAVDPVWCGQVYRLETLAISELINGFGRAMRFTGKEWKWIARQWDLSLTDENAEQRRWGRFGPPGRRAPANAVPLPAAGEPTASSPAEATEAPAAAPAEEPAPPKATQEGPEPAEPLDEDRTPGEPAPAPQPAPDK